MTHEQIAEVIAEAVKPILNEGRRELLSELRKIENESTGINRRITQKEFQMILREGYSAVNLYL
jgi:hypothetical protein